MKRRARGLGAAVAAVVLFGAAANAQATTTTVNCKNKAGTSCSGHAGALDASIIPSTHSPKIKANWPLKVTATLGGKPVHDASAEYEFLYAGTVVSTQYPHYNKHFTFSDSFSDELVFPPLSRGQPLTLGVVVHAGSDSVQLDWAITPVK
jgi:hypothetical protein